MDNFFYHNPTKVIFGKETIPQIGDEIKRREWKKVLLLAGGGSIKTNGVYDAVIDSLQSAGIEWVEVWGVRVNPLLEKVYETISTAKRENVDAILGVGGGSVIDSAKAVAAGCKMNDIWTAFKEKIEVETALPVFCVLTLSATGTEMDPFAVITHEKEKKKWPISGPALYPVVSIIDPSVQASLPAIQTAYGGIDAMSHIMEFHFMGTIEETTIALNESLMRSIIKTVDRLQENPADYNSRASLAWATTLALNGISGIGLKGGDWATHFIEHSISALYPHIAHAGGLAIVFPAWILHMQNYNPQGFQRWAQQVWNAGSVETAVEAMRAKYNRWGVVTSLYDAGIPASEIQALADNAFQSSPLGQLKILSRDDIVLILQLAA
ncbi:MAG: iron-containing alcohol dehydrogenase [Candidatus Omnitrophota bacterium]|jgi:alcohol dehydrogenase YqhD (iron-dependent ADH family)|nr:MAG: iron-containing alcohol dehydrogenase [Candidatus Omnitrophota bacterium]